MRSPAWIGNSSQAVPHLARVGANLKYQLAAGVASIPVTRPRPTPPHPDPQGSSPGRSGELRPRSLNRAVLLGRREAVEPPLRAGFPPAQLLLGVSLSVGPALPPRSLLLVLLLGCRAEPRILPSRLLQAVSLAAAAGKGSHGGAQQHLGGHRGSPAGAGALLSCPSSLPGRVSSLRRPSPLGPRLWLLSEAGGAGSHNPTSGSPEKLFS